MDSGVARRPIADFDAYRRELERFVFRSGYLMRPLFEADRQRRNEFLEQRLATLGARDRERAADLVNFLETLLEES